MTEMSSEDFPEPLPRSFFNSLVPENPWPQNPVESGMPERACITGFKGIY
jgi:hypothetical protein